ncbi:hypothetical protein SCUP515_01629 [Seiridium cupressi]
MSAQVLDDPVEFLSRGPFGDVFEVRRDHDPPRPFLVPWAELEAGYHRAQFRAVACLTVELAARSRVLQWKPDYASGLAAVLKKRI